MNLCAVFIRRAATTKLLTLGIMVFGSMPSAISLLLVRSAEASLAARLATHGAAFDVAAMATHGSLDGRARTNTVPEPL